MQQGQYHYSAGNSSDSALFNASASSVSNTNSKVQESTRMVIGDRQAKAQSINDKYCNPPATAPMISMPRTSVKYNDKDTSVFKETAIDKLLRMMTEDGLVTPPYTDDSSSTDLENDEKLRAVPDMCVLKSILANVQKTLPVSGVVVEVDNSAQFDINLPSTTTHTTEHSASNVSASTNLDALMNTSQNDAMRSEDVSPRQILALTEIVSLLKTLAPLKKVSSITPKHISSDVSESFTSVPGKSTVLPIEFISIPTLVSSNSSSVEPNQAKTSHLQKLAQQAILTMRKSNDSNITISSASGPLTSERFSPILACEPSMPHSPQKQVSPVPETQFYPSMEVSETSSLTSFLHDDRGEKKERHKERSRKKYKVRSHSPSERKKCKKHCSSLRAPPCERHYSPHRTDYSSDDSPHRRHSSPNKKKLLAKKFDSPQQEMGEDEVEFLKGLKSDVPSIPPIVPPSTPSSSQDIAVKIKQEKIDEKQERKTIIKKENYVDNDQFFAGFNQYYCKICQLQLNSSVAWKTHENGKKHAKAIKAKQVPEVARDSFTKIQNTWKFPLPTKGYKFVELPNTCSKLEAAFTCDYIIPGLNDVTEIWQLKTTTYFCKLCNSPCSTSSILPHLTGFSHLTNSLIDRDREYYDYIKDRHKKDYLRKAKKHVSRWTREKMKVMEEVPISAQSSSDCHDYQPGPSWRDTNPPSNVPEEERVGESEEYKCLDTSKGDFRCTTCDASMGDYNMYKNHIRGKRHLKNTKKMPGGFMSKAKSVKNPTTQSILERELNQGGYDDVIVGLDYVRETHNINGAIFNCFLCGSCNTLDQAIEHLFTFKHRLKYLEKTSDKEHNSFHLIRNMLLTEQAKEPIVIEQCMNMEAKYGRGTVEVYRVK